MLRTIILPAFALALSFSAASAQITITNAPPSGPPAKPTQEGLNVRVGQTPTHNPGAQVVGGEQAPVGTVSASPDNSAPTGGAVQAYARVPRENNQTGGTPTGVDARVNVGDIYRGVQVGK